MKELKKVSMIHEVLKRRITQEKAAELLGLSSRQIRRLLGRFQTKGALGLVHRLRGQSSNRKYPQIFQKKVLRLYESHYQGFGPTLAQEKLSERNQLFLGRETLRRWLVQAGLWQIKKKRQKHRLWRERKSSFGEMVQMDGSHHDWLEGRGPKLVLMGLIDDATNIVFARFYDYEGTLPAMDSFFRYVTRYGLPQSVYLDKHTTYRSWAKPTLEEELEAKLPLSQFERALEELAVQVIHADSPQAKGRIERLFGTFQDRLVKEMRLEGIKTKEDANRFLTGYLPKHNQRFQRRAFTDTNLHRPLPRGFSLKRILSIRKKRTLRNDSTVSHNKRLYLLENRWNGKQPKEIWAEERLDGKLYFLGQNQELRYREIKERPAAIHPAPSFPRRPPLPGPDHPWRNFRLPGSRFSPSIKPGTTLKTGHF